MRFFISHADQRHDAQLLHLNHQLAGILVPADNEVPETHGQRDHRQGAAVSQEGIRHVNLLAEHATFLGSAFPAKLLELRGQNGIGYPEGDNGQPQLDLAFAYPPEASGTAAAR